MPATVYSIFLDNIEIGTTLLEFLDDSMGIAFGKIIPTQTDFGYIFLRDYCMNNGIGLPSDDRDARFICTLVIPGLQVFNAHQTAMTSMGVYIDGADDDHFCIYIMGIDRPLFDEEFADRITGD